MQEQQCTRESLRVEVAANAHVDGGGEAIPDVYAWDINHTNEPYFCLNCPGNWETWEEALAHLAAQEVEA